MSAIPFDPMRGSNNIRPGDNKIPEQVGRPEGKSFGDVLKDFVHQADDAQHRFDDAIEAVQNGDTDNLHQVMLAQQQAQLSLKLASEVRNKLVEAYREVMRTQF